MDSKLKVIIIGAIFGVVGPLVVAASKFVNAYSITSLRLIFTSLFFLIFFFVTGKKVPKVKKKDWPHFLLIGFITALSTLPFIAAFTLAPVANVVLISMTYPFFVFIFSFFFLKEKASLKEWGALGIAFVGLVIMNPTDMRYIWGSVLAFISAIATAASLVYVKYEERNHSPEITFWFISIAAVIVSCFTLFAGFEINVSALLPIIFLALVTFMYFYGVNAAVKKLDPDIVALLLTITEPIAGVLLAYVLLDQVPSIGVLIGGALIVIAGTIVADLPKHSTSH